MQHDLRLAIRRLRNAPVRDPLTIIVAAVVVAAAALVAAYVPARHATRVDPIGVLRAE